MSNHLKNQNPVKRGSGGPRPNSGRKPDWFRAMCAKIIDQKELVQFVGRVASGEESDHRLSKDGDVVEIPASIHDRLYASEMLFDRGYGKPVPMSFESLALPLQKVINDTALLKMLYELNFKPGTTNGSDPTLVADRLASVQTRNTPA